MIAVKSLPFQTHSKLSSPFPLRRLRFQFVQWSFDALTLDQYMQLHSSALTQYDNHAVGLYCNLLLLSIPLQSLRRIVDSECLIVNAVYGCITAFLLYGIYYERVSLLAPLTSRPTHRRLSRRREIKSERCCSFNSKENFYLKQKINTFWTKKEFKRKRIYFLL